MKLPAAVSFICLFAVWCLLSGHYNGLLLTLGVASCAAAMYLYLAVRRDTNDQFRVDPIGIVAYLAWLMVEIVRSSIGVLIAVLDSSRRAPEFFVVDTGDLNELGRVIYANSITLTPGTVSTHVEQNSIRVHGLIKGARDDLDGGEMMRRVAAMKGTTRGTNQ